MQRGLTIARKRDAVAPDLQGIRQHRRGRRCHAHMLWTTPVPRAARGMLVRVVVVVAAVAVVLVCAWVRWCVVVWVCACVRARGVAWRGRGRVRVRVRGVVRWRGGGGGGAASDLRPAARLEGGVDHAPAEGHCALGQHAPITRRRNSVLVGEVGCGGVRESDALERDATDRAARRPFEAHHRRQLRGRKRGRGEATGGGFVWPVVDFARRLVDVPLPGRVQPIPINWTRAVQSKCVVVNSMSFARPHVRCTPRGRTCRCAGDIKKKITRARFWCYGSFTGLLLLALPARCRRKSSCSGREDDSRKPQAASERATRQRGESVWRGGCD